MKYSDLQIANEKFITDEMRNAKSIGGLIKAFKNRRKSKVSEKPKSGKPGYSEDELRSKYKKDYNIDLARVSKDKYTNPDQVRKLVFADIKLFLNKIKRDPEVLKAIDAEVKEVAKDYIDSSLTWDGSTSRILRIATFNLSSDFDGELAIIGHGDQEENTIIVDTMLYTLADMLELKWKNYIGCVGTGDGDEGCIYFSFNEI